MPQPMTTVIVLAIPGTARQSRPSGEGRSAASTCARATWTLAFAGVTRHPDEF